MIPIFLHDRAVLFQGEAADIATVLPANSVDAIITDPPAGIGFMGKSWDGDKGGRDAWIKWLASIMREAYRVLKPGGHALIWALPRTSHWTATACEDAGFEIRDVVMHLFGTGFPKSLNVGKAIDASFGAVRPVIGKHPNPSRSNGAIAIGSGWQDAPGITGSGSDEAATWEGWGTALKPAAEHWILARKPLIGTVAANVLAHGTGAINVDGCRIDGGARPPLEHTGRDGNVYGSGLEGSRAIGSTTLGRWPAHLVLDEEAAAALDEQSAPLMHGAGRARDGSTAVVAESYDASAYELPPNRNMRRLGDTGGASRFFYVAKAPRAEKDDGLDHLPMRSGGEATDREEGSAGLSNPRAGAGRTGGARNYHPTVKSIALMRWLVRLITPPGGVVLDLFTGSGTTGVAALAEGFEFVGVERDLDDDGNTLGYCEIAKGRLEHALKRDDAA